MRKNLVVEKLITYIDVQTYIWQATVLANDGLIVEHILSSMNHSVDCLAQLHERDGRKL